MSDRHNHRVNLTLPPDVLEIVRGYSDIIGKPPSTMIRDLLIEMLPMMQMIIELSKKAEQEKETAFLQFQLASLNTLGNTLTTITDGRLKK